MGAVQQPHHPLLSTGWSMGAMPLLHPPLFLTRQSMVALRRGKEKPRLLALSATMIPLLAMMPWEILAFLQCDNQPVRSEQPTTMAALVRNGSTVLTEVEDGIGTTLQVSCPPAALNATTSSSLSAAAA